MPPLSDVPAYRYQSVIVSLHYLPRCLHSIVTFGKPPNIVN